MNCDFCTVDLYSEEVEFLFDNKHRVWCGYCRKGSHFYFLDFNDRSMVSAIEASEDHAKAYEQLDDPVSLTKKKWIAEEVERAKRELLFRLEESV